MTGHNASLINFEVDYWVHKCLTSFKSVDEIYTLFLNCNYLSNGITKLIAVERYIKAVDEVLFTATQLYCRLLGCHRDRHMSLTRATATAIVITPVGCSQAVHKTNLY